MSIAVHTDPASDPIATIRAIVLIALAMFPIIAFGLALASGWPITGRQVPSGTFALSDWVTW